MAKKVILEPGRTFSEFSLLTDYTTKNCNLNNINLKSNLGKLELGIPFLSAAMTSVTGYEMALALGKEGGLGVLPARLSVKEQVEIIDKIKGYEMGFVDCLLKPVNKDRFKNSIERLIHKIECQNVINKKKEQIIHFKCNFKSEKLKANNIRWVEAMGDYVKVVTNNKNYMVLSTMKSFLDKLPKNQFIRIHKSYIVNLKKVINYSTKNVNTDGEILPLSRKQKEIFKENFLNFQ